MTIPKKIKMVLSYLGISEAELARRLGKSAPAFNQRMKTGKFSSEDLDEIAVALGAEFKYTFKFPDGTEI
jgi:transcriptional regulator with XRE-family HTH domain